MTFSKCSKARRSAVALLHALLQSASCFDEGNTIEGPDLTEFKDHRALPAFEVQDAGRYRSTFIDQLQGRGSWTL